MHTASFFSKLQWPLKSLWLHFSKRSIPASSGQLTDQWILAEKLNVLFLSYYRLTRQSILCLISNKELVFLSWLLYEGMWQMWPVALVSCAPQAPAAQRSSRSSAPPREAPPLPGVLVFFLFVFFVLHFHTLVVLCCLCSAWSETHFKTYCISLDIFEPDIVDSSTRKEVEIKLLPLRFWLTVDQMTQNAII